MTLVAERPSKTKIPFLDLRVTDLSEAADLLNATARVLTHGRIVNGPEVERFESEIAARCEVPYAVGVGSGTDALLIALRALNIGKGDEVIVPALSFIATANAIRLVGAEPVFCDIRDDLNTDVELIKQHIGPKTKAIMPVHWAGRMCDMRRIGKLAEVHKLIVIEDACQAFGSTCHDRSPGYWSDAACFSMNAMKVLGALGDAGCVVTGDGDLAKRMEKLRYHGMINKEFCDEASGNHRLDTLQAALLLVRLKRIDAVIERRRNIAAVYDEALIELGGLINIPYYGPEDSLYTYTIQTDRRDELKAYLERQGIETKIHHPLLMPCHAPYLESKGDWSNAARLIKRVLCLPCHEKMSMGDAERVAEEVRGFFG